MWSLGLRLWSSLTCDSSGDRVWWLCYRPAPDLDPKSLGRCCICAAGYKCFWCLRLHRRSSSRVCADVRQQRRRLRWLRPAPGLAPTSLGRRCIGAAESHAFCVSSYIDAAPASLTCDSSGDRVWWLCYRPAPDLDPKSLGRCCICAAGYKCFWCLRLHRRSSSRVCADVRLQRRQGVVIRCPEWSELWNGTVGGWLPQQS